MRVREAPGWEEVGKGSDTQAGPELASRESPPSSGGGRYPHSPVTAENLAVASGFYRICAIYLWPLVKPTIEPTSNKPGSAHTGRGQGVYVSHGDT